MILAMKMQKHISLLFLVYALGVLASSKRGCGEIFGRYSNSSCIESEKQALLLFKESFLDGLNILSSWVGDDCCAWYGIGCNNRTGHVVQLDLRFGFLKGVLLPSLLDLKYLTYLDLSYNMFDGTKFPEFLGSFKDLTYLNLSTCLFEGFVPHHLGNLSNLQYLDLTDNVVSIDSMGWLSKLSSLEYLDLTHVNLSQATDWVTSINMLPNSMLVLKLYMCDLPDNIPHHHLFMNLTSLISLDLGYNSLNSSFPLSIINSSSLAHLRLGGNLFNGPIPKSIGRLTSLLELVLSSNHFNGSMPVSIETLTSLSSLDFSDNYLLGSIPECIGSLTSLTNLRLNNNKFEGWIPKSIGRLASLSELDLSDNNFEGFVPQCIGNLTSLSTLKLSVNKLSGSVPPIIGNLTKLTSLIIGSNEFRGCLPEAFCQLSKLESLDVTNNQLNGPISKCIGELSNLTSLELSSNSWDGILSEHHFINLTRLTLMSISSKSNLVLNVSSKWIPPFQLEHIYMQSVKVGPQFPQWLLTQNQIASLIMLNTSISDTLPADWFGSVLLAKAYCVDLSYNDIYGEQLSLISAAPNSLSALALSVNRFSGDFPAFVCNLTELETLVLSNNNLSGELPQCLGNLTTLRELDLKNNNLSGDIPASLGSLEFLNYLNLHNNKFQGKLPLSFQNMRELYALDVGKNNLRDTFPPWIGVQLTQLRILILRSNTFYGEIPAQLCRLSSIQVLNMAHNQFMGNIPACFSNFSALTGYLDIHYPGFSSVYNANELIIDDDSKGYEQGYTTTLWYFSSINLSNNKISGEIPDELMDLRGLVNLNLAGNHLAGRIPDKIGTLRKLQVLDLSRNDLSGPIPQSLSDLNFLSSLNLSFNHLTGRIPTGNQLQTLTDPSIYAGNNELCGQPVMKPCSGVTESHNVHHYSQADSDSDDVRMWFYAGMGPGLLVGFLGFCGSLHFIKSWMYSYFQFVQEVFDKIMLFFALLRRKFYD